MMNDMMRGWRRGKALGDAVGDLLYWLWFQPPAKSGGGTIAQPKITYEVDEHEIDDPEH